MAQQNINIGTANAKTGDTLFDAFGKVQANFDELYAASQKTYWFDVSDLATASSPIAHTGGTPSFLTNDGLGPFSNSFNPESKPALWNPATNAFDFSSLKIGDVVMLRVGLLVDTTAASQTIELEMDFGIGNPLEYSINFEQKYYKAAANDLPVSAMIEFYIGNEFTRTNPAKIKFISSDNASITVQGWYVRAISV